MTAFKAPVDDILFSLRHIAQVNSLEDWNDADAETVLKHFAEFSENVLAPLNAIGDLEGARLENGRVKMPNGFVDAYKQLSGNGWQGLTAPIAFGGQAVSPLIAAGITEIFTGANHAMQMICSLAPGAVTTLLRFGSNEQQSTWIPRLISGEYLSTMCLTEPGAGSDLSAISCRASRSGKSWSLSGEKIFISGGDQNLSEGIMHLVLARSGDSTSGLAGLSLFLCPSQPAVRVTRIEEKMGLHASPTCQMLFEGADVELVGDEGGGLKAMFSLMNEVRIDVALQGVAHAAYASLIAEHYANERRQGRRHDGQAAHLSDHADVRRMLDEQRCLAIGTRAMCHVAIKEVQLGSRPALVEFLTSLCKVAGSEAGMHSADLGIQILGGYGYLTEYGLSQIWRDARITPIYEGTNGIHKRAMVTRGLRDGGAINDFVVLVTELAGADSSISKDVSDWLSVAKKLSALDDATPHAHSFGTLCVDLLYKAVWIRIAAVAEYHPDADELKRISRTVFDKNELFTL